VPAVDYDDGTWNPPSAPPSSSWRRGG